jgi:hypothetical protein
MDACTTGQPAHLSAAFQCTKRSMSQLQAQDKSESYLSHHNEANPAIQLYHHLLALTASSQTLHVVPHQLPRVSHSIRFQLRVSSC